MNGQERAAFWKLFGLCPKPLFTFMWQQQELHVLHLYLQH